MKITDYTLKKIVIGSARAAFVTFLAFLFSFFILQPISFSAFSLFSAPEKKDFTITDFYTQIANNRPVRTIDQDIVLVDIGYAKRDEISEIINNVNLWQPKVVGVDILFARETPDDSLLLVALNGTKRLVLPIGLDETSPGEFEIADVPFFYPDDKPIYAASNLPAKFEGGTIREFATSFPLKGGGSVPSFPMAVAKEYEPESLELLLQRKNQHEKIDYASRDFITLGIDDIKEDGSLLTDRIVLIGSITDGSDMHSTPINHYLSGLQIQASSIATILNGNYFDPAINYPPWVPASVLCFLILLVRELTNSKLKGIITRLLQLAIVYYAGRIGYSLYVDQYRIFDFSYILLMVTFGFFAGDIWLGIEHIADSIKKYIVKLINKRATRT